MFLSRFQHQMNFAGDIELQEEEKARSFQFMEERALQNQRIITRRFMETQLGTGAEVRRLNVVYFLSRKGRIEHPHLIRIHHLSRNGVHLRDVKRWLGDLRGKDMPESFSWSYKRRYKTGYVWQDLFDDDLITPISDNEYVVKGSEISSTIINKDFASTQKKSAMQKDKQPVKDQKTDESQSHSSETSLHVPRNSSSEIEEESLVFDSETSTLTDDSTKLEMEKTSDTIHKKQEEKPEKIEMSLTSGDSKLKIHKKDKRRSNRVNISEKSSTTPADSSNTSSEPRFEKSKSYSTGASNIFRNLMSCGALSTNDSAVVMINKQNKYPFLNVCVSDKRNVDSSQICKRDKLGGSHRIFGTPKLAQSQWSGRKSCDGVMDSTKNKIEFKDHGVPPCAANFKPISRPNCSRCGKPFKPEKLHVHMKSCGTIKSNSKEAINSPAPMIKI